MFEFLISYVVSIAELDNALDFLRFLRCHKGISSQCPGVEETTLVNIRNTYTLSSISLCGICRKQGSLPETVQGRTMRKDINTHFPPEKSFRAEPGIDIKSIGKLAVRLPLSQVASGNSLLSLCLETILEYLQRIRYFCGILSLFLPIFIHDLEYKMCGMTFIKNLVISRNLLK